MRKFLPLLLLALAFVFPPIESVTNVIDPRTLTPTSVELVRREGFAFIGGVRGKQRIVTHLWLIQLGVAGAAAFLLARQWRSASE
jgi:hypothetical protein